MQYLKYVKHLFLNILKYILRIKNTYKYQKEE